MEQDRVVREIQKETREELLVVEQKQLDREAKRKLEIQGAEGASRVVFEEREWRKRRAEGIDEIRRIVDSMGTPREERLRIGERVFLPPEDPLPPTRALVDLERKAIERHLGARITRASIIYRSAKGHVVEVEYDRDGRKEMTLLSVLGERVRDLGSIHDRIDEFRPKAWRDLPPPPAVEAPPPEAASVEEAPVAPAPDAVATPAPEPVAEAEAVEAVPAEPEPPAPPPEKRRFGLPRLGRGETEEPAEKRRFSFPKLGRKKEASEREEDKELSDPEAAPAEPPPDEKKSVLGRFLKRK